MQSVQSPRLETAQSATARRLGWYFTELRGRHDEAVFRQPRPPVVEAEASLCLARFGETAPAVPVAAAGPAAAAAAASAPAGRPLEVEAAAAGAAREV